MTRRIPSDDLSLAILDMLWKAHHRIFLSPSDIARTLLHYRTGERGVRAVTRRLKAMVEMRFVQRLKFKNRWMYALADQGRPRPPPSAGSTKEMCYVQLDTWRPNRKR